MQIEQCKVNGLEEAFVTDAQDIDVREGWEHYFDAAFSNAALHWCKKNPRGVLKSIKKVLKPGSRFVCEMGGFLNCIGETQKTLQATFNME